VFTHTQYKVKLQIYTLLFRAFGAKIPLEREDLVVKPPSLLSPQIPFAAQAAKKYTFTFFWG